MLLIQIPSTVASSCAFTERRKIAALNHFESATSQPRTRPRADISSLRRVTTAADAAVVMAKLISSDKSSPSQPQTQMSHYTSPHYTV